MTPAQTPERLTDALEENIRLFERIFHSPRNKDLIVRRFETSGFAVCLLYIEGMAGNELINEGILKPAMAAPTPQNLVPDQRAVHLDRNVLNISETQDADQVKEMTSAILDGKSVLLVEGYTMALVLETRDYEKRQVDRAQTESVVIGSQQGFVENLRTNLTLIHRIVRTPSLTVEMTTVGTRIPTRVALVYLDGVVNENILKEVRRRVRSLIWISSPTADRCRRSSRTIP